MYSFSPARPSSQVFYHHGALTERFRRLWGRSSLVCTQILEGETHTTTETHNSLVCTTDRPRTVHCLSPHDMTYHNVLVVALLVSRTAAWGPDSPIAKFWSSGSVQLIETSHSDIFFTGQDVLLDASEIVKALDIMRNNSEFMWQHECILFLRVFVELHPEREAELVQRMREGRFDIGATFTEGFEGSMYNEALVRQMYEGRKWFVERYPGIDSAAVAFHQDAPLRSLQMPQVYSRAGVRYLKASRFSDKIFRWAAPDGSSLLAYEEFHYYVRVQRQLERARAGSLLILPDLGRGAHGRVAQ